MAKIKARALRITGKSAGFVGIARKPADAHQDHREFVDAGVHFAKVFGPNFAQGVVVGRRGAILDAYNTLFFQAANHLQAAGDHQPLYTGFDGGGADMVKAAHIGLQQDL